jgi:transcriptional regulator with XRE-family HTH domain
MNLGERIKQARKNKNLTQKQLADIIGVAEITLRQYENNKRKVSLEQLEKITRALNEDIDYMIFGKHSEITTDEANELGAIAVEERILEHLEAYKMLDEHGMAAVDAVTAIELQRIRGDESKP